MDVKQMMEYYSHQSEVSDPDSQRLLFKDLPADLPGLVKVVQNTIIHVYWSDRMGAQISRERKDEEMNLRTVENILRQAASMQGGSLLEERLMESRLVGTCRDYSTLLTSIFRSQGVPARARCGFGTYFLPDHFEDHWVCEWWNENEQRWVMTDAQLDDLQKSVMKITFDTLDLPPGQFVTGGDAWQMCRAGNEDPNKFGIFEFSGMDFIRGNLMRDFLSLNKVEVLPWDFWGLLKKPFDRLTGEELALFDHLAELTSPVLKGEEALRAFVELREIYDSEPGLRFE